MLLAEAQHHGDVVLDQEEGDPVLLDGAPQGLGEALRLVGVEPGEGLVEQHDLGGRGQSSSHLDQSAGAQRQVVHQRCRRER